MSVTEHSFSQRDNNSTQNTSPSRISSDISRFARKGGFTFDDSGPSTSTVSGKSTRPFGIYNQATVKCQNEKPRSNTERHKCRKKKPRSMHTHIGCMTTYPGRRQSCKNGPSGTRVPPDDRILHLRGLLRMSDTIMTNREYTRNPTGIVEAAEARARLID